MLDADRKETLLRFLKKCKLQIKHIELLNEALTHSSYVNEVKEKSISSNERLEYLGDAVLGLVISEYLYKKYPQFSEGKLSKIKGQVVSSDVLSKKAKELGIGDFLLLGKGEQASGGNTRLSSIADAFESVVGAIYLDSGLSKAASFIIRELGAEIKDIKEHKKIRDYKSILQELSQKHFKKAPEYELISETGPDHKKTFEVKVIIGDKVIGCGAGNSKKSAEQEAAKLALEKLK